MTTWITTPHGLLAWAATYLLHSTVLLSAAWGVSRLLAGRSLRLEERLWKAALVGALLTATVQTGVASLPVSSPVETAAARTGAAAPVAAPALPAGSIDLREVSAGVAAPLTRSAPDPRLSRLSALLPGWQKLALGVWALGALLLTASLAVRWVRLRVRLRPRRDVEAGAPRRLLDRLIEDTESRRRVRLTGSSALPVPVALGVGEQEICLPSRALRELDDRRQQGLLAHELAHLERRDPAWLLLALGLESALFFQPLNRLARRRLEEIAELQCDAWAVRATGDRLGLARCLTEVAGWLLEGRGDLSIASAPGTAAMARRRGQLGTRVRRILASGPGDEALEGRRRWLATAAAAGLLTLALLIPGLAPSSLASPGPEPADPQVAPGAEGVAADDDRERAEREAELRAHQEADADFEHEGDRDREDDRDHDPDWDFDFDESFDPEEIEHMVAMAMEAARAGLMDADEIGDLEAEIEEALSEVMAEMPEILAGHQEALDELHRDMPRILAEAEREMQAEEGRRMTDREREELRREIEHGLAEAQEELRHAMEDMGPRMEELRRVQREVSVEVREEMRRAHEELERVERTVRQEVRREYSEEARAEMREAREAHRELEEARRELDRERQELERERRELHQERERLERERERAEEPPAAR